MKKYLLILFIASSLFGQINRHPIWVDLGAGVTAPKAQYNLFPFGNQLGNLGSTGTRWNFAWFDTTTTNYMGVNKIYENEPVIFKGNEVKLLSPYTTKNNVYRGQLHAHTTNSDGAQSPTAVVTFYKNKGYNFISITDHDVITTDPSVSGILFIQGAETSYESGFKHVNQINVATLKVASTVQSIIDTTNKYGNFTFLNHPMISPYTYSLKEFEALDGYYGIEVWNALVPNYANAEIRIDSLLTKHRKTYLIATDDTHDTTAVTAGTASVYVFADECTNAEIMSNLKAGNFYASNGALITSIVVSGHTVTITTPVSSTIAFIGKNNTTLQTTTGATTASYTITGDELYMRIKVARTSDGKMAWSNPIYINDDTKNSYNRVIRDDVYINERLNIKYFTLNSIPIMTTGTQLNYLANATGTTGTNTSNVVYSISPTLTGQTNIVGLSTNDLPTYSSEFLSTSGWTSSGWTGNWATGWIHTVDSTAILSNSTAAVSATKYQIAYTITNRTAGSFTLAFGGQSLAGIIATGAFGPTTTSTANLTITPTADFNGKIVISIKSIITISTALVKLKSSNALTLLELRTGNIAGNIFLGKDAGAYNTTGGNNSAVGNGALYNNTTGINNTAIGASTLYHNTVGGHNFAGGESALYANITGSYNTAVGRRAGRYTAATASNTNPIYGVYVGYDARTLEDGQTNEIVVGANTIGKGSNTATWGNTNITQHYFNGAITTTGLLTGKQATFGTGITAGLPFLVTNKAGSTKASIDSLGSASLVGISMSGALTGSALTRGTNAFTTTATADTVAITGASVNDIYVVSYVTAVTAAEAPLSVVSTATGFIVRRPDGTTSGAVYAYIRQK